MPRRLVRLLASSALLLLLTAAGFRHYGGEATVAVIEVPRSADPVHARTGLEHMLTRLAHAGLFAADGDGARPLLVDDSFEAPADGTHYVLTLDEHARFADGARVKARDVSRSLHRLARSESGWILSALDGYAEDLAGDRSLPGIRVLDDRRLVLTTRRPFHGLAHLLSAPQAAVVRTRGDSDPFWGPVGAGPFRPVPADTGEVAAVTASTHFPGGRPFLQRLGFQRAPDRATAAGWLRRERAHAAVARSRAAPPDAATVVLLLGESLSGAERNHARAAIDRELLANVFLRGRAEPAHTLLPPGLSSAADGTPPPPADPPTADAGAPQRRTLWVPDTPATLTAAAERLVVDLLGAGILVERRTASPAEVARRAASGDYDLLLYEWRPVTADPALALWEWSARPALRGTTGSARKRLELLPGIASADARLRAAMRAERELLAAGRVLPLVHPLRDLQTVERLRDLRTGAPEAPDWANAWLQRERAAP